MDTTGSMSSYIAKAKSYVLSIINSVLIKKKNLIMKFAFISYKDH